VDTKHNRTLRLQVVADLICPWCFIGKRSLDQALKILAEQGLDVDVDWLPYQLNPAMPTEGMDRKEFRSTRGVPSYLVGGKLLFSGSQDVDGYVKRLSAASSAGVR
jgi:predicted DsbA family dithiol-disulfide isomerase